MPQSLAQVWIHVIFSTKERRPFFGDPAFREAGTGKLSKSEVARLSELAHELDAAMEQEQ